MAERNADKSAQAHATGTFPDLTELCRIHEIGLDLIDKSHDLDGLLDRVLDEYETRLQRLPSEALDARAGAARGDGAAQLRGLVMFATQAAALKEKAVAAGELRRKAAMLEESNARLQQALDEARRAHARLEGVLAALSSGVMILHPEGGAVTANGAARALAGLDDDPERARLIVAGVPRDGDAEIDLPVFQDRRTLLVSRRALPGGTGEEVVLVTDVTSRNDAVEERVRLEKLAEVLKTLSVLSHKINNPLTALLGRAQMLQAHKGENPMVVKAATVIEESSLRIADLIRELTRVVKEGRHEALDQLLDMNASAQESGR